MSARVPMTMADPGGGIGPVVGLAPDQAKRKAAHGQRGNERTQPVEPGLGIGVARLLDVGEGRPQRDGEEGDIDQEGETPAEGVDHDPADDRAKDGQGGRRGSPDPECPTTGFSLEGLRDQGQRTRHEERTRCALEKAEHDEQLKCGRQTAQRGRDREPAQTDRVDAPTAEMVGEGTREDQQRGQDREIAADDVGLAFEYRDDRRRQLVAHLGQGHVDDRSVEKDRAGSDHRCDERPALAGGHRILIGAPGEPWADSCEASLAASAGFRQAPG